MEQDIYLYPGSQSEAHRLGEAALWDASFHANVSCARDIEAVIRVYGDGRRALKPEASQMVLKRWDQFRPGQHDRKAGALQGAAQRGKPRMAKESLCPTR